MAQRESRIFWRDQGGERRAYADFRDYADVGGGREALKPDDSKRATTDPDVAAKLVADRVAELQRKRKSKGLGEPWQTVALGAYAETHLRKKAREGDVSERWLKQAQRHLEEAVSYFGKDRDVASITPKHAQEYTDHLRTLPGRGGTVSTGTVRKYLNSLSNLYRRAISEGYAQLNPVGAMFSKPTPERKEANYLEPYQIALLLESARTYKASADDHGAFPWMFPLLATFAYTGGRKSEVLGLEVDDVSFRMGRIFFRENEWRGLKTSGSKRDVPLWPELETILREYILDRERAGGLGRLLFPSLPRKKEGRSEAARLAREKMVRDVRKALDHIGERVGWKPGEIRLHALRHSYIAARIQTLDRGAPVALYTVAREVGHKSTDMIADRYGHLIRSRNPRAEELVYRVKDHPQEGEAEVRKRLERLRKAERAAEAAHA